jgi:hypothetical protein
MCRRCRSRSLASPLLRSPTQLEICHPANQPRSLGFCSGSPPESRAGPRWLAQDASRTATGAPSEISRDAAKVRKLWSGPANPWSSPGEKQKPKDRLGASNPGRGSRYLGGGAPVLFRDCAAGRGLNGLGWGSITSSPQSSPQPPSSTMPFPPRIGRGGVAGPGARYQPPSLNDVPVDRGRKPTARTGPSRGLRKGAGRAGFSGGGPGPRRRTQ